MIIHDAGLCEHTECAAKIWVQSEGGGEAGASSGRKVVTLTSVSEHSGGKYRALQFTCKKCDRCPSVLLIHDRMNPKSTYPSTCRYNCSLREGRLAPEDQALSRPASAPHRLTIKVALAPKRPRVLPNALREGRLSIRSGHDMQLPQTLNEGSRRYRRARRPISPRLRITKDTNDWFVADLFRQSNNASDPNLRTFTDSRARRLICDPIQLVDGPLNQFGLSSHRDVRDFVVTPGTFLSVNAPVGFTLPIQQMEPHRSRSQMVPDVTATLKCTGSEPLKLLIGYQPDRQRFVQSAPPWSLGRRDACFNSCQSMRGLLCNSLPYMSRKPTRASHARSPLEL